MSPATHCRLIVVLEARRVLYWQRGRVRAQVHRLLAGQETTAARGPVGTLITRLVVTLAMVAFVGINVLNALNDLAFDGRFRQFDADREGTLLTYASVAAAAAAAVGAFARALVARTRRIGWLAVSVILAYLALDDLFVWHERIGDPVDPIILPSVPGIWFPLYLPFLIFVFVMIWSQDAGPYGRVLPRVGLLLLVLAVVAEGSVAVVPGLDGAQHRAGYTIEVGIEEAAELVGWLFIAVGLAFDAFDQHSARRISSERACVGENPVPS